MKTIRLICRDSRLSLLQAEIVKKKIENVVQGIQIEILGRRSRGDNELSVPLSSLEGSDFFTEEIFRALQLGEADIAVHSLKDMSAPHFFCHPAFAVVDRDDPRDVAIFNPEIIQKIREGKKIIIGTCSPRREAMATVFLKKALPQLSTSLHIEVRSIRGSVESRLQQLNEHDFDATILATAGLNRLLRSDDAPLIRGLLHGKRLMFLPMVECVPAPCQGAIVAEADPGNKEMQLLLGLINNEALFKEAYNEKQEAFKYGTGCLQPFGVTTFRTSGGNVMYAAGIDSEGRSFSKWTDLPVLDIGDKSIFTTTDFMGSFFSYDYPKAELRIDQPVVYVANYKAIHQPTVFDSIRQKRIWTSGTKSWFELAKRGLWVEGSADAFGLESLEKVFKQPMVNIDARDVDVITHLAGASHWQTKGWKVTPTYTIIAKVDLSLAYEISQADIIFWTSIHQYLQYKDVLKDQVIHMASSGETGFLLKQQGITPLLFPNIKAFEQWRKYSIPLPSVV